jgi:hypothetical protein
MNASISAEVVGFVVGDVIGRLLETSSIGLVAPEKGDVEL